MSNFYLLAIDQGTTSTRVMLFDQDQHLIAIDQKEFKQYFPKPGWVEHDADEIWQTVLATCQSVIQHVDSALIAGIGISNQRETSVLWEKDSGKVLGPAIVWQDRRTFEMCERLKTSKLAEEIHQKTGLLVDPYFSATKIRWMLDHFPLAREKAAAGKLAFGTMESFLIWRLTGGKVHVTDATNASRTLLMNLKTRAWDPALLKLFGIPENILPKIVSNAEVVGKTFPSLFPTEIPLSGMAGDQQAALIGQACIQPGMLKTTLGTGAFLVLNTGEDLIFSQHQLLSTIAYEVQGKVHYALEGSIFNAGAVVKWLRDQLQIIREAKETESLAKSVQDNAGVYFVPAFTGLGAPYWQPEVQGVLFGLTRGTTRAHVVRAGLESIAYQLCDIQLAMTQDRGKEISEMRVDGGLTANHWLLQFMSDMLHVPILLTANQEASCVGAAVLAGIGVGCYADLPSATQSWRAMRKFLPSLSEGVREKLYQQWLVAIQRLLP